MTRKLTIKDTSDTRTEGERWLDECIAKLANTDTQSRQQSLNAQRIMALHIEYHHDRNTSHDLRFMALTAINRTHPYAVAWSLWYCYGLGTKPAAHHFADLERFRVSDAAQQWFTFLRGREYQPMPVKRSYGLRREHLELIRAVNVDIISETDAYNAGIFSGVLAPR